jgi:hypothetical protein
MSVSAKVINCELFNAATVIGQATVVAPKAGDTATGITINTIKPG